MRKSRTANGKKCAGDQMGTSKNYYIVLRTKDKFVRSNSRNPIFYKEADKTYHKDGNQVKVEYQVKKQMKKPTGKVVSIKGTSDLESPISRKSRIVVGKIT
jgi:hypothetical protein